MSREALKLGMWLDQRIVVIETRPVTDNHDGVLHSVDPAAAVRQGVGWKSECVRNAARRISIVRKFPQLFHAETVNLRIASFVEAEAFDELLSERSAWSFAEHRNLRAQIDTRFIVRFAFAFFIDALIASAHAENPVVLVVKQIGAGKLRKDVYARLFTLLT